MSGSATTARHEPPRRAPRIFFLDANKIPAANFAAGGVTPGTDTGMRFVRLDEHMSVSRMYATSELSPTPPTEAEIRATTRRLGPIPWQNNPIELITNDTVHPLSLDPGRLRQCAGLIPDGPSSLSQALPTHGFYSKWLTTNDLANPPESIIDRLHNPLTAPYIPPNIVSGPFVFQLLPDANDNACMRILVTIECEAGAELFENDSSTSVMYSGGARNGVVLIANEGHPWVFSEVHGLGFAMISEGAGEIGRCDRVVYVNQGLMSLVYDGDDAGILNNTDIVGQYPASMAAASTLAGGDSALARQAVLSNHGGLGSIGASCVRRFRRHWSDEFFAPTAPGSYDEAETHQTALQPGQCRVGATTTNALTSTATINEFLRFPSAAGTTKNGTQLVCFAYIDQPMGTVIDRADMDILAKDYLNSHSGYGKAHYLPITSAFAGTREVNGVRVFDLIVPSNYKVTHSGVAPGGFTGVDLGYSQRGEAAGPTIVNANYGNHFDRVFFFAFEADIAAMPVPGGGIPITTIPPIWFTHIISGTPALGDSDVSDDTAVDALTTTLALLEVRTGTFWTSNVTGEAFDKQRPLTPFISPRPYNHPGVLTHSPVSKTFVIGYPLGYHGSVLRGNVTPSGQVFVAVQGVRRVAASTVKTVNADAAVVQFSVLKGEVIDNNMSSVTRPAIRVKPTIDSKNPLQETVAPLMWEPATMAGTPPEFATIGRPDGWVIRSLTKYIRNVTIPRDILKGNMYATPGVVKDADITDILGQLAIFNDPTSDVAKRLWAGEEVMPAASLLADPTRSLTRIRGTLIAWGREMFRYAKMIEMAVRGSTNYLETTQAASTMSEALIAERKIRVGPLLDACVHIWTGIRTIIASGCMPRYDAHDEVLTGTNVNNGVTQPGRVEKLNIIYNRASPTSYRDNDFIEEMAQWTRLRYDRTMCEDPRGLRPVWGGMTTRHEHELTRWAVVVDPATARPNLDMTSVPGDGLIPLVQLSNLAGPATPLTDLDFRFQSDTNFSHYSFHHIVYGYLLYAAAVCLRYASTTQRVFGGVEKTIAKDCEELLTNAQAATCGGTEPFPLLLILHDFLSPLCEFDANIASGSSSSSVETHIRVNEALNAGATSGQLASLAIPDTLVRGVRALGAGDMIRRPFPPMRSFDLHSGHSWGPGPEPNFRTVVQESSTESALAYYAAYQFLMEVQSRVKTDAVYGVLSGSFLLGERLSTNEGVARDLIVPWNAIVGLAHEVATSRVFRDTQMNLTITANATTDTFGSSSTPPSLNTSGAGHPVTLSPSYITNLVQGFMSQAMMKGVARNTTHTFLQEDFRPMPAKILMLVGSQSVPLVPGLSTPMHNGINDPQWLRYIANISNIGNLLTPFTPDPTETDQPDRWTGLNQSLRPKVATLSQWIDFILLHLDDSNATGTPAQRAVTNRALDSTTMASPDVKQWARLVAAAVLHRVRPLPSDTALKTFHDPVVGVAAFPKDLAGYLPQSSYWDVVTWYRANHSKMGADVAIGNTAPAPDTNQPHFTDLSIIPPIPSTTLCQH